MSQAAHLANGATSTTSRADNSAAAKAVGSKLTTTRLSTAFPGVADRSPRHRNVLAS